MPAAGSLFAQAASLTEVCGEGGLFCRWVYARTESEFLARFVAPSAQIVLIVAIAFIASILAHRLISRTVEEMKDPDTVGRINRLKRTTRLSMVEGERRHSPRRAQRADALGALGRSMATAVIWLLTVFLILGAVGINLAPLIASAGIVGIALGFGAQELVQDLISGVFMLVEDQYGVGDIIDVGEATGVVESVGLRSTRIRSIDGTLWHVPNGEIRRVGNMSQQWARALLDISVAYDTDVDAAMELITDVACTMAGDPEYADIFLDEPEMWGVEAFAADSIVLRLVINTRPAEQWKIARELRRRLKHAFDEASVEIPFPQRTVWLRTDVTGSDDLPAVVVADERGGAGGRGSSQAPATRPDGKEEHRG